MSDVSKTETERGRGRDIGEREKGEKERWSEGMKKKGRREREKGRQISEAKREREGGRKAERRSKGKQRYVHILYTCSIHRHTQTCTQTCTHIDTHINTYTDRHTRTQTRTYTQTDTHSCPFPWILQNLFLVVWVWDGDMMPKSLLQTQIHYMEVLVV